MSVPTAVRDGGPPTGLPADESTLVGVDDRFARRRPALKGRGRLLGPALLFLAWALVTGLGLVGPLVLPSPWAVAQQGVELVANGSLPEHFAVSLQRAMLGLFFGVLAGTSLAVISGLFRLGENLVDATMQMLRAMPILALVPLAIVWFGIGEEVKIILVALGVAFPMYLNTHAAIRAVDSQYLDLAKVVGLSKVELIRHVILPGALPGFFTGLRFAASVCWLVLVVSEQINATTGIGFLMTQARAISATDTIVVGLVVYAVLGLLSDSIVRFLERKALTWRSTLAS